MSRAALATAALLVLAACTAAPPPAAPPAAAPRPAPIPDSRIGLRSADVLVSPGVVPAHPVSAEPGEATPRPAAHPEAPPVVPHSVDGMLPITREENACTGCHVAENAADAGAPAIPASHLADGALDGRRYLCVSCHVPQTDAAPLVENRFRP